MRTILRGSMMNMLGSLMKNSSRNLLGCFPINPLPNPLVLAAPLFLAAALGACSTTSSKPSADADQVPPADQTTLSDAEVVADISVDNGPTSISPGVGIGMRESTLLLGDTLAQVTDKLGKPSAARDMGAAGVEFEYGPAHVGGLLAGSGDSATVVAVYLFDGFAGETPEALGIGSSRADWTAAYGAGVATPFSDLAQFPTVGLVAEFNADKVVRVHVIKAAADVASCPPKAPFGHKKGDLLANLTFKEVDGSDVKLHALCGNRLTLAFNFHGW